MWLQLDLEQIQNEMFCGHEHQVIKNTEFDTDKYGEWENTKLRTIPHLFSTLHLRLRCNNKLSLQTTK